MRNHYLLAIIFTMSMPFAGSAANESCPVSFDREIRDKKLYLYGAQDGQWIPVEGIRKYSLADRDKIFAYGIRDKRNAGGMVLFKIVDISKGEDIKKRTVQLSRNGTQRRSWGRLKSVPEMRGHIDVQLYQDIHGNDGRDINTSLRSFHTRYQYDEKGNRDTFDSRRRNVFTFEQVKGIEGPRSFFDLFRSPAMAGVKSGEGIVALRSTLKYYAGLPAKEGGVVCFTAKIDEDATRTQVTVVDVDNPGPYADHEEVLQGHSRTWGLRWEHPRQPEE
jgi:hypothetical protein